LNPSLPAAAMDRYHHLLVLRHLDAPSRAAAMNMIPAEKQPDAEVDVAEEYVTMAEFASGKKAVITTEKSVGYDSRATAPHLQVEDRSLAPRVQVRRRLIRLISFISVCFACWPRHLGFLVLIWSISIYFCMYCMLATPPRVSYMYLEGSKWIWVIC